MTPASMMLTLGRAMDPKVPPTAMSATPPRKPGTLSPPPVEAIQRALGADIDAGVSIEWLAGDGSDRCYYRVRVAQWHRSFVLMQLSSDDAAKLQNGGYEWIQVGELLERERVFIPKVVATLPDHAALIIQDYGDIQLEDRVRALVTAGDTNEIHRLYIESLGIIGRFARIQPETGDVWCTRAFDAERFDWELAFFRKNYLEPAARIELSESEARQFETESRALATFLGGYSHYFVHRDYHSRNLMVDGEKLAVLDFQDARLGPLAYDLVSLVYDSYVPLTPQFRTRLLSEGIDIIARATGDQGRADMLAHWKPMLLQRQLKAIGSFGYLTLVKGRRNYLQYVGPALSTLQIADVYDERWPFLSGELLRRMESHMPTMDAPT